MSKGEFIPSVVINGQRMPSMLSRYYLLLNPRARRRWRAAVAEHRALKARA